MKEMEEDVRYIIFEKSLSQVIDDTVTDVFELEGDTDEQLIAYASSTYGIPKDLIEIRNLDDIEDDYCYDTEDMNDNEEDSVLFYEALDDEYDLHDKYILLVDDKTLVAATTGEQYELQGEDLEELIDSACEEACILKSEIVVDDIGEFDLDSIGEDGIFDSPLSEDELSFCENLNDK